MIYDSTDRIFAWKFWQFFKWVFGALCLAGLIYLIWDYYMAGTAVGYITSFFLTHGL